MKGNHSVALLAAAVVVVLALGTLAAQSTPQVLTNADIIRMAEAKLGDPVILAAIEGATQARFDVTVDGLIALKRAGVSDAVITAMQKSVRAAPSAAPPAALPVAPSRPPTTMPAPVRPMAAPQEPTEPLVSFRVNPSTGELIPLEKARAKQPQMSALKEVWLDGPASPVTFKSGEPHTFVILLVGVTPDHWTNPKTTSRFQLERLTVKKNRRYASLAPPIPLNVTPYGQPKLGLDKKKPNVPAHAYMFAPQYRLEPGEYALSWGDMFRTVSAFGAFAIIP
jgi:hypothetical protein